MRNAAPALLNTGRTTDWYSARACMLREAFASVPLVKSHLPEMTVPAGAKGTPAALINP